MRTIDRRDSLEVVWGELVYTEARTSADRFASDFAPRMTSLVTEVEEVRRQQLGSWRTEIVAQAEVDAANDDIDELVVEYADTMLFLFKDRKSSRFTRYFGNQSPHKFVRMGLEAQLAAMKGWPTSIQNEPEEQLKAFAVRFTTAMDEGDVALADRVKAAAARVDFRVKVIEPFIDKVNSVRTTLYADLLKRADEKKLPKGWADTFFRPQTRNERPVPAPTPPNP
jgi:hypothetical protein